MAIVYHGIAINPANAGTNAISPTVLTPPGCTTGDLVVVVCGSRLKSDTHAVSQAGGQSWTKLTTAGDSGTFATVTWFYCVFNGSWSASPSFSHGGTNNTCMMHVFTPTAGRSWAVDVAQAPALFAAPSTPFDITITGITCAINSFAIASWFSADDNTWAYQTGTNWTQPASGTVNNMAGSDTGMLVAYRLMAASGGTGSPIGRQTAYGGDPGYKNIMSFKEYVPNSPITGISGGVTANTGVLKGSGRLYSASNGITTNTGVIKGKGRLYGTSNGITANTGDLIEQGGAASPIAGISNGSATNTGILTAKGRLYSTAGGAASLSGGINGKGILYSVINTLSALLGSIVGKGRLYSTIENASSLTGDLTGKGILFSSTNGVTSVSATIVGSGRLYSEINTAISAAGTLKGTGSLTGSIQGVSSCSALLNEPEGLIIGIISGISEISGTLTGSGRLLGSSDSIINVGGTIGGIGDLKGEILTYSSLVSILSGTLAGAINGYINGCTSLTGMIYGINIPIKIVNNDNPIKISSPKEIWSEIGNRRFTVIKPVSNSGDNSGDNSGGKRRSTIVRRIRGD